ncbi:MAG: hypothetical protein WHS44_12070 [Fimbriimonadales bacterium]|nr:MAG: hypothetical protein KatS3mg018_2330 [Fimbriimonadales bacterium]
MKRKLMWLAGIGAIAALAYAQTVTVRGAFGHGLAGHPDAERPNAQFNFSVKQVEYNGQTRTGGGFAIEVRTEQSLTTIQMANANRIAVDMENHAATFSGPAVAVQRTRQGVQRTRGVAVVRVGDLRNPRTGEGDPDTIAVRFFVEGNEEPVFTYRGIVRRGDIVVFEETRSR